MDHWLAPIFKYAKQLATDYTTARAAKLDNLDAAISAISAINSIQSGSISLGTSTSASATITAVATGKSVVIWQGVDAQSGSTPADYGITVRLANSTTVTADRNGTGNSCHVRYTVVEFK